MKGNTKNTKTKKVSKTEVLKRRPEISIFELFKRFPTEESFIKYFQNTRYGSEIVCPHCGEDHRVGPKTSERAAMWQCYNCKNSFSIFKDTIFEKSTTDLRKWAYAILQVGVNAKKGISACQLQRDIDVSYHTALRMLRKVREAMGNNKDFKLVKSVCEIDETYIGGKPRRQGESKRGRGTKKIAVVGVLDRKSGKVFAHAMLPDENNKQLTGKQLLHVIERYAHKDSIHATDEFRGYNILSQVGRERTVVNHSIKQWVNEAGFHTNGIENFWSLLNRMMVGSYHKVTAPYIDLYLAEEAFRYSNRFDLEGIFDKVLEQAVIS